MVTVDESLTRQVAELARLELTPQEVAAFTAQLREVLGYVDQLQSVDVASVEPLTHPLDLSAPLRPDEARAPFVDARGQPKVLFRAPEVLDGGFKVPPIL